MAFGPDLRVVSVRPEKLSPAETTGRWASDPEEAHPNQPRQAPPRTLARARANQ